MIRKRGIGVAAALAILLLAACRKEKLSLPLFREIASPVAGDISAIWMSDSLNGVAVGGVAWKEGFILSTADGGQSWLTDTILQRKMEHVMFDASGQGYACGQDMVLHRPPGSRHWYDFRVNYQWNRACFFPDDRQGVMVGGGSFQGGQLYVFGPDAFWKLDTFLEWPNALESVWCSDALTVHAVGLGWVLRSDDGGQIWQRLPPQGDFFRSVQFPTSLVGYICGSGGTLLKTTDGGRSWQTIRKGGSTGRRNKPFRSLWFVSADKGYVVGDDGLFWRTDNGGADWVQVREAPDGIDFTGVYAKGGRGWAVAKGGRIFYFED
ncbi:MAG: YCF48-related protein [Saprospiraceae bacterium]|nr:hypothetical protein [Saprospiraceae bacterium]